jgi:hypothetical protein
MLKKRIPAFIIIVIALFVLRNQAISLLAINLHKEKTATIFLPETDHIKKKVYSLSTDDIYGSDIYLNGNRLSFESGKIPDMLSLGETKDRNLKELNIPPTSFSFVVLHN